MSFFVYIIKSKKDGSYYIGHSKNLSDRISRHNRGLETYTRKKVPWDLIWNTEKETRSEAMKLERKLKNFKSRKKLEDFINRNPGVGPDGAKRIEDARPES